MLSHFDLPVWHLHWLDFMFGLASFFTVILRSIWGMSISEDVGRVGDGEAAVLISDVFAVSSDDLQLTGPGFNELSSTCPPHDLLGDEPVARFRNDGIYNQPPHAFDEFSDSGLSGPPLSGDAISVERDDGRHFDAASSSWQVLGCQDQPVVSAHVQDALVSRSLLTNFEATDIKLPWETGIYKDLFSDDPLPFGELVPKMQIGDMVGFHPQLEPQDLAESVAEIATARSDQPIFCGLVSCVDDAHFVEKRKTLMQVAIGKLLVVVYHCLSASQTGRHIVEELAGAPDAPGAPGIIEAVVGVKSPATLIKRANSLLAFLRWCAKANIADENPFTEQILWQYFSALMESSADATKGASALSGFRFAYYVLGFDTLRNAVTSRRLIGICDIMLSGKRCIRQALVLTVTQVMALHRALRDHETHYMDKAVLAYLMFALYGRCRHSDLQNIFSLECDYSEHGGYILIQTCCHKTGRLAALKSKLLPIVIPARGVDGSLWAEEAMAALLNAGVGLSCPINGPLLHAPNLDGTFMQRGLSSKEVSGLLRKFAGAPEPSDAAEDAVTSHSLKATTLSWCSKYGLTPQTRSLLGRHVSALNETYAIYSRDLACAPVAELQLLIDEIHAGNFMPDSQRSKFFAKTAASPEAFAGSGAEPRSEGLRGSPDAGEILVKPETHLQSDDGGAPGVSACLPAVETERVECIDVIESSDSSSSSEPSSSSESDAPEVQHRVKRFRARIPQSESWFVHRKSHLVHRYEENDQFFGDSKFLVCGKQLTDAYVPCTEASAWNTLCKSCNRK